MRHVKNIIWCLYIGCVCATIAAPAGANQHLNPACDPQVADEAPCTEYEWVGKALVRGFDGEMKEIIGRGTVCAYSRDEARKLAHEAMFNYASQFGYVVNCGADLAG